MSSLRLPGGAIYETGGRKPPTRTASTGNAAVNAKVTADLVKAGAAAVKEQIARKAICKELEDYADRADAKALAQAAPSSELGTYYRAKARSAREKAAQIRRGENLI